MTATALLSAVEQPNLSVFDCLNLLQQTTDNYALQMRVCERLSQLSLHQLEFWLPQLVHLFITVETEAAALENLLLNLCTKSTHFAVSCFWELQASLSDFRHEPYGYPFTSAKRLFNKLQPMLFATGELPPEPPMRENAQPALVMSGMVALAPAAPFLPNKMRSLVEYQGRKQRSSYLLRRIVSKRKKSVDLKTDANNEAETASQGQLGQFGLLKTDSQPNLSLSKSEMALNAIFSPNRSMPAFNYEGQEQTLKTNYFRCETQLMYALNAISQKLLQVPKKARLSALQLELTLLNEDLPNADVDLPMLLPQRNNKQNRLVGICVQEATVLNSAEKAPFLLLIEYLRGELTFDVESKRNKEILKSKPNTHIFERPLRASSSTNSPGIAGSTSTANDVSVLRTDFEAEVSPESMEFDLSEALYTGKHAHLLSFKPTKMQLPIAENEYNAATSVQERREFSSEPSAADLATQWRTAQLILNQLDDSTHLPRQEVHNIKQRITDSLEAMQMNSRPTSSSEAGERRLENDLKTSGLVPSPQQTDNDDPSAANLGEDWQARKARIRKTSKFGSHPNWDLVSVIVKSGDDLRQEALASQLIQRAAQVWREHHVGVWVRRMQILITGANTGLVETITNALSLHSIKKALTTAQVEEGGDSRSIAQLNHHFEAKFGPVGSNRYQRAVSNFAQSLAGYSVLCYLLQIKDRHNGNILIDSEGHIIHIDFGFMLSNSPGRIGFEVNTFKLTHEYVELMGGIESDTWKEFKRMLFHAFLALRQHADDFVGLVEIMARGSPLPCFQSVGVAQQLRQRFMLELDDEQCTQVLDRLVDKALGSYYTKMYDLFQMATQGIYP